MSDGFQMNTEEDRNTLLTQARQAALLALQEYELAWTRICFNQMSDTITFKIETETSGCFLLRLHSSRMNAQEIQSELDWLHALGQYGDIPVSEGLAARDGSFVLKAEHGYGFVITLMRWLDGEHSSREWTDDQVRNTGALMARLHEAATAFVPPADFKRPTWGVDSFRSDMARLCRYYDRFLSEEAWKSYQQAAEKIIAQLNSRNNENYGVIHADLHAGNLIFRDAQPVPIDFGRCGYGYFLYDMAGAMIGMNCIQRQMFLQGYERVRELAGHYEEDLSCFFVKFMIENYCHHAPDSRETASLIAEQPYAQAIIRAYLKDEPFLFQPIEPLEIHSNDETETRN